MESRQSGIEHNITIGGNEVAWLNAARARSLGPSATIPLTAGDSINLKVFAKYEEPEAAKINKGAFIASGAKNKVFKNMADLSTSHSRSGAFNPLTLFNILNILAKDVQKRDAPQAYMGYSLYDADSNLYQKGKYILSKNAANQHEILKNNIYIPQDGYMETYLVNETTENVCCVRRGGFDDFSIRSTGSPIVQETYGVYPESKANRESMGLGAYRSWFSG